MANAAGTTWIAGWPREKRLPSSISRKVPAVPLINAAASDPMWRPSPIKVALPLDDCLPASARSSGSAEPATIAAMVSASIHKACSCTCAGKDLNCSSAAKLLRVSR
jgi:hypothetical protein